ncbi:MAG: MFS transporter, partial [Nocardioidaceae bacterium]
EAVPLATAVILLANTAWVARLPKVAHETAHDGSAIEELTGGSALRNRGFLAASILDGVLSTHQVLLNVVIPLWLVEETDAPRVLLAWLFGTNTVMCIFLPAYTTRGVHTLADALKAVRFSGAFFVLSCLITMVTHSTSGLLTVTLVWLGPVTVTGAELAISASSWAFQAELMDPRRRGEYGGVQEVFATLGGRWAPAAYTFLALSWHGPGWLVIAAIVVLATAGLHPAVRAAEAFLQREVPADVLARDRKPPQEEMLVTAG